MSVLGKTSKEEIKKSPGWKKMLLPGYIIFSLFFILYTLYNYLGSVVYQQGIVAGQQQGVAAGQDQGYTAAVQDLAKQVGSKCEPVAITVGDEQIDVINVACLQQQNTPESTQEEVSE